MLEKEVEKSAEYRFEWLTWLHRINYIISILFLTQSNRFQSLYTLTHVQNKWKFSFSLFSSLFSLFFLYLLPCSFLIWFWLFFPLLFIYFQKKEDEKKENVYVFVCSFSSLILLRWYVSRVYMSVYDCLENVVENIPPSPKEEKK